MNDNYKRFCADTESANIEEKQEAVTKNFTNLKLDE